MSFRGVFPRKSTRLNLMLAAPVFVVALSLACIPEADDPPKLTFQGETDDDTGGGGGNGRDETRPYRPPRTYQSA